jgi:hypothetical protein
MPIKQNSKKTKGQKKCHSGFGAYRPTPRISDMSKKSPQLVESAKNKFATSQKSNPDEEMV